MTQKNHNYGIDLLRIILMICIIIGHLYAHTEIRNHVNLFSDKWFFTWFTQAITVSAVNCFVIITGYFMLNASYNLWNLVKIWAKVFFYSVFLSGVLVIIGIQKISFNVLLNAIFPILRHEYWFFTIYILLFLLIPFINVAIRKMSKKMHGVLVLIILLFFYIEPLFSAFFYEYDAEEGFSIIAFLTLYIIGAYLSRCNDISIKRCIFLLLGSSFLMLFSKITLELIVNKFALSLGTGLLYHNNSIFVLINAIALFEIFKQIRLSDRVRKIVSWISSSVF